MADRSRIALVAIVVLAIAIRLAAIAIDSGYEPRHDSFDYDRHARSIATGAGYPDTVYLPGGGPTAIRPPGYPYALGAAYVLFEPSPTVGRVLGAFLGGLSAALVFLIASRIWGRRTATVAGLLAAIFPPLVALSLELYSESLFIPLLLAATLLALKAREKGSWGWAALAGGALGLAALTRGPGVVALIPILLGLWFIRPRLSLRSVSMPAAALLCALLVVAPWGIRNYSELGTFVPLATSSGFGLAGTYNEASRLDDMLPAGWRTPVVTEYRDLFTRSDIDEAELDSELRRRAGELAGDHPGYVAEVIGLNLLRILGLRGGSVVSPEGEVTERGIGSDGGWAITTSVVLALVWAAVGAFAMISRRRRDAAEPSSIRAMIPTGPLFMWLVPAVLVLVALPVAGLPRYRVPADPFVLMAAAVGLIFAWDRLAGSRGLRARVRSSSGVVKE